MKKVLFRTFSLLIGLAFVLVFLEVFLRINPKFGYNYSSLKFKNDKLGALNDDNLAYIRPSALLGYEVMPNCSDRMPVASNSYGLMGKEYGLQKKNNTFRILILGDSIAWQNGVREFLEGRLNSNFRLGSKYKFEIWNAGCPSYDVRRYYLYLKHKGLKYKPDMVITFLFMNDFNLNVQIYYKNKNGVTEYYFPIEEISKSYAVNPFLMKHSYLYRFIVLNLESYLNKGSKRYNQEEDGRYYLSNIKEMCRENKTPFLIIIFPYLKPLEKYADWQKTEYATIHNVIKELKIDHIDLYPLYDRLIKAGSAVKQREDDEIHPNRDTESAIADIIYDYLLESRINPEFAIGFR